MDPFEPQLVLKKEVRFSETVTEANPNPEDNFGDVFGGIIRSGQWGWLTTGSRLRISSLRTGQLISKFEFDESNGFGVCIITCVSEIQLPYLTDTIIAIGIQYADCPGGLVVIYSIEESTVIRCIELKHKITCCKFISQEMSQHTVLQNMNGCLSIGTDNGRVLLIDLNLRGDELNASVAESDVSVVPCHVVDYSMSLLHLHRHFQHCQQEGVHFGIQLEVLDNAKFIQSLLPIDLILSLAVGLADGRLVLYDLTDMQVFYVAAPQERSSPLVKMNFMEPPDDPRSCVYIWAFHENYQNSMAVMHSLMYEKRVVADDGFCYFENFQVSCVRLLLPLNCAKSVPITCQAITKAPSHGNEETISLCALVWKQDEEIQTEVLLFDINQWYKEEMPYVGDWREDPSYLASFVFKGLSSIEMYFNPHTISLFNSIQRPEEHFYPVSLSFDAIALGENSCVHLNWPGAQNRVINAIRSKGSLALLDPNPLFREILNTRLLPQFTGMNYKSTFSLKAKRETLLSVAIEQNCIGLLKECARNWADGSHQGKSLSEGLSMSTLTDWLWTRASSIKERCNTLGEVLFNHSGCTLDQREQKELGYISKQLKILADLLSEIVAKFAESIPSDALSTLESQGKSIRMASDYQEILLWLLNIGLLPEASRSTRHREVELNLVPYPYEALHRFYEDRRVEFTRHYDKFPARKTRSCYLLFIDSFIEHEFKGNTLRDSWQENGGDGLYPPTSIQSMLRIMLIPEVTFENKCALFLYFFLDLNTAIEDKRYEPIVQNFIKFPSVFKLSASLIKQIQAFWNLDHCRFQAAVDEFISPFNKDQVCPQWQLELFLESLLAQNEANLALRVLEAKPSPTSPVLQLNTYLANDLISEAFHFARSKQDEDLLKLFFTRCLCTGKFGVIRDLALTESEGNLVQSLLKNSKSRNAENLHFVYLLQKYKYIEAVSYLDELSKGRVIQRAVDVDTPNLVLSAYNTTMTPVTKGLSDVYFKIKNKIKSKEAERSSPYPLSCQLIKQNANDLLGGIYHSSALSAHFASHYWERHQSEGNTLQQSTNAPFLRRPQVPSSYSDYNQNESISYPDPYKAAQKRRLDNNSSAEDERGSKMRENPKKRRKIYDRSDMETIYKPLSREQPTADNLLTHFKNVPTHSQDMTSLTRKLQKTPPKERLFFLETPYVKRTVADTSGSVTSTKDTEKPGTSLQGILKVSHLNPKLSIDEIGRPMWSAAVDSEKRGRKDVEEEKSIRFILPSVDDESEEHIDEQDVQMESENDEEESLEDLPQSIRRHVGPAKRKSLRSYSSYVPSARVVDSRSPSKKSNSSPEEPPSKLSAVARDTSEIEKSDEQQSSIVSVRPLGLTGRRSALSTVRTKNSEDQSPPQSDNVKIIRTTVTEQRSTIVRESTGDSEEEVIPSIEVVSRSPLKKNRTIQTNQPTLSFAITESKSPILEKARSDDFERQATSKLSAVARDTTEIKESDEQKPSNVSVRPMGLTGRRSALRTVITKDSEDQSYPQSDNVKMNTTTVTEQRSTIVRDSTGDSEEESISSSEVVSGSPLKKNRTIQTNQPTLSFAITESKSSILEKARSDDFKRQATSKLSAVARHRTEIKESDEQKLSNVSVRPLGLTGRRSALRTVITKDSEDQSYPQSDNVKMNTTTVTEQRSTIVRDSTGDSEEESISSSEVVSGSPLKKNRTIQPNQPTLSFTMSESRSPILEKNRSDDSEKQSTSKLSSSSNRVVSSRPSLRARTIETEIEPRWFLEKVVRSADSEKQEPFSGIDTTDKVRIIPVTLLDENYYSQHQQESTIEIESTSATTTYKTPKRALSESSDERTNESTHFAERKAKQLRGRASIHSSLSDISDLKSSVAPESEIQTKSNLHPPENILKTDTTIDFQPHCSSSKVCATESKFNVNTTESVKVFETESKFHSEEVTSKVTFSERSTVIGGLTYMPTLETTENVTDTVNITIQPRDQMLDTTIGMTLYDTLGLDQSHHQPTEESSNSGNNFSDSKCLEEESTNSELNAFNDQASENSEVNDDSGSVILLSSRSSSSRTFYGDGSENTDSRTQEPPTRQFVIDGEEDDESDGIDILDSDVSGEGINSFSYQFDEAVSVTRTSTSCSIQSNTDTVLSSAAEIEAEAENFNIRREVEEGEEYCEEIPNETNENEALVTDKVKPIDEKETVELTSATTEDNTEQLIAGTSNVLESEVKEVETKEKVENQGKILKLRRKPIEQVHHEKISIVANEQNVSASATNEDVEKEKKIEETVAPIKKNEKHMKEIATVRSGEVEDAKDESDKSVLQAVTTDAEPKDNNEKLATETLLEKSTTEGKDEEREEHEEELTPNPQRRRSKSFSKKLTTEADVAASPSGHRNSRGGSMPPASGHPIVTRRRSLLLETLTENATPDSPSTRTRSKIRADSIDGDADSPSVSNIKRSRLSSVSSVTSVEHPQTPKSRRRSSMSVDKELSSTPKAVGTRARSITSEVTTPIKTPRRLSVSKKNDSPTNETSLVTTPRTTRARSITADVSTTPLTTPRRMSASKKNDSPTDQTNLVSSSKGHTEEEEDENEPEISQSDDYKSSRRLTRTQLAVLEKSAALATKIAISPVRITRRRASRTNESPSTGGVKESDTESISSQVSQLSNATSSRRVTRSSALKEHTDEDLVSIASSTESGKRRRKRIKEATSPSAPLTAIPEEDVSGSEGSVANSQTSKRSRRQKK